MVCLEIFLIPDLYCMQEDPAGRTLRSFHAHGLVLSSASKYFEARIESGLEGEGAEAAGGSCKRRKHGNDQAATEAHEGQAQEGYTVLNIPVEAEELDAAEALLRCM